MDRHNMEQHNTDVLVIGTGLAGLIAAIRCKEAAPELSVTVCSKSPPGLASCSTVSEGAFRCSGADYDRSVFVADTVEAGFSLNERELVKTLVDNIDGELAELEKIGVTLVPWARGLSTFSDKTGKKGVVLMRPILQHALALGINMLHPYFAWDLLLAGDRAAGVSGYYGRDGVPLAIAARAVVLAAGGGGALYSRTDNPPGTTGDGYGMLWRAGLSLSDMEFVQFYPLGSAFPGKTVRFLPAVLADAGIFVNDHGEDIVEKYAITEKPLAVTSRDTLCRAMVQEVQEGRGISGAVRLEFNYTDGSWEKAGAEYGLPNIGQVKDWTRALLKGGHSLPVMPVSHFFCGGVDIDSSCRSALEGLFAPGEVAAGLHGANRLGGNALSEALVFGALAGREAASWAKAQAPGTITAAEKQLVALSARGSASGKLIDPAELRRKLAVLMWEAGSPVRREQDLAAAAADLETMSATLKNSPVNMANWRAFLELENLLLTARLVIGAALARTESRGCHYRADYPHLEEAWEKRQRLSPPGA